MTGSRERWRAVEVERNRGPLNLLTDKARDKFRRLQRRDEALESPLLQHDLPSLLLIARPFRKRDSPPLARSGCETRSTMPRFILVCTLLWIPSFGSAARESSKLRDSWYGRHGYRTNNYGAIRKLFPGGRLNGFIFDLNQFCAKSEIVREG